MVWLAGKLQRKIAAGSTYVEDQRKQLSLDFFSAWPHQKLYRIILQSCGFDQILRKLLSLEGKQSTILSSL